MAFTRLFGELDPPGPNPYGKPFLPDHPEMNVISNIKGEDGAPIGGLGDGEAIWHADMTYTENPPMGAILHALEVPPSGGDTYWANMVSRLRDLARGAEEADRGPQGDPRRDLQQRRPDAQGLRRGDRSAQGARRAAPARAHASRDRPQVPVPRPPAQQLRARPRPRRKRGAARRAVGARDAARAHLLPALAGRRCRHVGQPLHASPARRLRPVSSPPHAPDSDQGQASSGAHGARSRAATPSSGMPCAAPGRRP